MPLMVVKRRKGYGFASSFTEELNWVGERAFPESVSWPHTGMIP